jgi:uncharacterized protein (DUF488 family)
MQRSLFTIGYEGAELEAFLATLTQAGVEHLVDVRDVPISRKKGFSKSKLSDALATVGIRYTHLRALGDPKDGREAMKRGDYRGFLQIYLSHIAQDCAQEALEEALSIANGSPAVLLCYERSPKECHRTIVAQHLTDRGSFQIRHLGVAAHRQVEAAVTKSVGQGAFASAAG